MISIIRGYDVMFLKQCSDFLVAFILLRIILYPKW